MTEVLIVIGSARKGRVADKITGYVQAEIAKRSDINPTIVDLETLGLPFFNNELTPSDEGYTITNPSVQAWSDHVTAADAVIFITPEYNHSLSAIQKNAIDSLFKEWNDKPLALVAYGWYGGANAAATVKELAPVIKANLLSEPALLGFKQDVEVNGTVINAAGVEQKIQTVLDQVVEASSAL
ncbi:NAD(P)H-dependent oxidoreductase [Candidatus Saccharibacteria bacterium]|nr:NAD(P)H-dependent oxidoreductase [Candidatus Saccharibacteria bacterium]